MTSQVTRILVTFVLAGSVACTGANANNAAAKKTIETAWNSPQLGLVVGQIRFIDPTIAQRPPDASKGEDALSELPLYRAFVKKGFITLSDERDLTTAFTGWGDWFQLTQSGVRRTARVTLTDTGRTRGELKKAGAYDELFLSVGHSA